MLGWTTIEAKVEDVDDEEAAERVVIENAQRKDLNAVEQALAFQRLANPPFNLGQEKIAEKTGKDQTTISRYLAIARLHRGDPKVYDLIIKLGYNQLLQLIRLVNPQDQFELAQKAVKNDLSVSRLRALVDAKLGKPSPADPRPRTPEEPEPDPLEEVWQKAQAEISGDWEMTYEDHLWVLTIAGPEKGYRYKLKEILQGLADAIGDVEAERLELKSLESKLNAGYEVLQSNSPEVQEALEAAKAQMAPEDYQRILQMREQMQGLKQRETNPSDAEQIQTARELAAKRGKIG
jgi:ParB-like chromosome segregation protein Spo0J